MTIAAAAGTVPLANPRAVRVYDLEDPNVRKDLTERVLRNAEVSRQRRQRAAARKASEASTED
ncbi:hypothetical protein [Leifsonia poae]|uniref:hypothetical protein n=1 Tax=Leifsonia poae TaxID=110933 RepID=UPI003D6705A9